MMENIRFSVHIPVYNVEKYLAECVNSVLNQTYKNFEIILVDDGSTDKSPEICDSFNDSRVKTFHNKNAGVLLARNFAVNHSNGEYSIFIDSDDYVEPDYLERVNDIIESEKCDILVFEYKKISGNNIEYPVFPWKEKTIFQGERLSEFKREMLFSTLFNPICIKVIKTSLLQNDKTDFESIRAKNGEDLLASLYPVFNAEKIVFVPEYWYIYRQHNESVTHSVNPDRYKSIISVRKKAYEYFEKSDFYNEKSRSEYSSNSIKSMMDCVIMTAGSKIDYERKLRTFDEIICDDFYIKMLKYIDKSMLPMKSRLIFELFNRKKYKLIILICRIFSKR